MIKNVSETLVESVESVQKLCHAAFSTLKRRPLGLLTPRQPFDYLALMYKV